MSLFEYDKKQKIFKNVLLACQHLLVGSKQADEARKYINSRLGKHDQLMWEFGYFPTDDRISELTNLINKKDLEYINLYYPKSLINGVFHGHFSDHNLIMPFRDVYGNIVAFLGRSLLKEEERQKNLLNKYKYSTGCNKELYIYGLDKAKEFIIENDFVIGVEGQFDCISLHSNGIKNAVAFGWANMSKYQMFQLHRYTNNIILMFDNDEAGMKAKKRVKDKYKNFSNIKIVSPPKEFKDIDEFFHNSKNSDIKYVIDKIKSFGERNGQKI